MKALSTIAKVVAYIGMAPLFPVIAVMWVFATLCPEAVEEEQATEPADAVRIKPDAGMWTDSQLVVLDTAV